MKLPLLSSLSQFEGVSSRPPPRLHDFWNSKYSDYFTTAGISSKGSFIPLLQTLSSQADKTLSRRVITLELPRGYSIPKLWTILEPRGCQTQGVSFNSKNYTHFFNSKIPSYFTTAGISSKGSFITLLQTLSSQRDKTLSRRVITL